MGKVWTYLTMTAGLIFLMKIAGIPTGVDWILTTLGFTETGVAVSTGAFTIAIIALFSLSSGAAIVIGAFGRTAPEYALLAPFAVTSLVVFLATFASIADYMSSFSSWIYYPVLGIMGVFAVGFIWSTVEFVFGRT